MAPLKIALVASEVAPFAKTGGLADVVAALGRALHFQGHDVRIFLPRYGKLRPGSPIPRPVAGLGPIALEFASEHGGAGARRVAFTVEKAPLPDSARADGEVLDVEFISCPALFHREAYYTSDPDEAVRWAAFSRAALETCQYTGWAPNVIHCNDWHAALIPLYLRTWYAWDSLFSGTKTLLSIHNIGYQGTFPRDAVDAIGMGAARKYFHQEHLENDGKVSFLETGILHASWLSTVSTTYAREIQTSEFGMGLDGLLRAREDHLTGIVNGIDTREWNPASDPLIPHHFSAEDLSDRSSMRSALRRRMGLAEPGAREGAGPMIVGIVSRMTGQKGFELLPDILPVLLQRGDLQLAILGSGEERHERYFDWLRKAYPGRVGVQIGFDNELAHWIEAGSDLFLMPSRYEPCGLNQMYSLRYGCVPLVRSTGGLADTVVRWDPSARTGTGFVFYEFTPDALYQTLKHALDVWRDPAAWAVLQRNGMAVDFSWERQSAHYVDLYQRMLERP